MYYMLNMELYHILYSRAMPSTNIHQYSPSFVFFTVYSDEHPMSVVSCASQLVRLPQCFDRLSIMRIALSNAHSLPMQYGMISTTFALSTKSSVCGLSSKFGCSLGRIRHLDLCHLSSTSMLGVGTFHVAALVQRHD
jgi:hypothetical protein